MVRDELGIRVAYINFLPGLTLKEIDLNSEYHAPHKDRFMVFFLLVGDHEQLFYTSCGVWMFVSHLFINHITKMLH